MELFFTIFNFIIDTALILLSYIVPKKKNLILFGAYTGKTYNGNPKYLIEYLKNNKILKYEYYWVTKRKNIFLKLKEKNIPVLSQYTIKTFWKILRAKYLIIDYLPKDILPFGETTLGNFYYINTWHGSFIKKIGKEALEYGRIVKGLKILGIDKTKQVNFKKKVYNSFISFNVFLVASILVKKYIEMSFDTKEIVVLGYPRNDSLFDNSKTLFYFNNKLDKINEVFLYAPTWRNYKNSIKPFSKKGLCKIHNYLSDCQSILFIKKHPADKDFGINFDKYNNIVLLDDDFDDIYDVLKFTTCLITDVSGVYFDFILKDMPTIFYRFDNDEYLKNCRNVIDEISNILPGPFVYNEVELLEKMKTKEIWFNEVNYKKKHFYVKCKFNQYTDGKFCQTFFNRVLKTYDE